MKATKEFIEGYRCYNIYKFTFNTGEIIYNGISDYVHDGFVTVTGNSKEEVILGINNVYKRMQLAMLKRRIK